jgi:hypothetical protein
MGIINVLFTMTMMSILMVANMDMNMRMAKQQETQKVDSEVVYMTNELRKNVQNVVGDVSSLKVTYPNGTAINSASLNLKLVSITVVDQDYYGSGVYTLRLQANFERNNVFGPKVVKRDIGMVYCNSLTSLSGCGFTAPVAAVPVTPTAPASDSHKDEPCNH